MRNEGILIIHSRQLLQALFIVAVFGHFFEERFAIRRVGDSGVDLGHFDERATGGIGDEQLSVDHV